MVARKPTPASAPSAPSSSSDTSSASTSDGHVSAPAATCKFKGVRMRSWGKWVTEIRLPNTRARLWLGSYATPHQAARAYDVALVCLRGTRASLNFPDSPPRDAVQGLPYPKIQELAAAAAASAELSASSASPSSPTSAFCSSGHDTSSEDERQQDCQLDWQHCGSPASSSSPILSSPLATRLRPFDEPACSSFQSDVDDEALRQMELAFGLIPPPSTSSSDDVASHPFAGSLVDWDDYSGDEHFVMTACGSIIDDDDTSSTVSDWLWS